MNAKIYTGNIQPNPKEYKIWVNDEGVIKTWNGTEWIELSGESGGTASKYAPRYYTIETIRSAEYDQTSVILGMLAVSVIFKSGGAKQLMGPVEYNPGDSSTSLLALGVDLSGAIGVSYNGTTTMAKGIKQIIEFMIQNDPSVDAEAIANEINQLPTITEEEYYEILKS